MSKSFYKLKFQIQIIFTLITLLSNCTVIIDKSQGQIQTDGANIIKIVPINYNDNIKGMLVLDDQNNIYTINTDIQDVDFQKKTQLVNHHTVDTNILTIDVIDNLDNQQSFGISAGQDKKIIMFNLETGNKLKEIQLTDSIEFIHTIPYDTSKYNSGLVYPVLVKIDTGIIKLFDMEAQQDSNIQFNYDAQIIQYVYGTNVFGASLNNVINLYSIQLSNNDGQHVKQITAEEIQPMNYITVIQNQTIAFTMQSSDQNASLYVYYISEDGITLQEVLKDNQSFNILFNQRHPLVENYIINLQGVVMHIDKNYEEVQTMYQDDSKTNIEISYNKHLNTYVLYYQQVIKVFTFCGITCSTCIEPSIYYNDQNYCSICLEKEINNRQEFIDTIDEQQLMKCICKDGYFEQSNFLKCCPNQCSTCNDQAQCLTCPGNDQNRIQNPDNFQCSCLEGYYDNLQDVFCLDCHFSCKKCENDTYCQVCKEKRTFPMDQDGEQIKTGYCVCIDGTFLDENNECIDCDPTCKTCSSTKTKCDSCDDNKGRILEDNQCICKDKYKQISEQEFCCQNTCSTCSNAQTCDSCDELNEYRELNENQQCVCMKGYYQDLKSTMCLKCHKSCSECENSNTCSQCVTDFENYNRQQIVNGLCECKIGFFDQGEQISQCDECDISCHTCNGTENNQCESCDGEITGRMLNINICECKESYNDNGNKYCCSNNCLTCVDKTKDQCDSCNADLNRELINQKCECIVGYYQEGSDHSQACIKCHKSCSECNNGNSCTVCVADFENYNREQKLGGFCECKIGFFEQDGEELQCGECDTSCHSCSGVGSDKCLSCDGENTGRFLQDNICKCQENYNDTGNKFCCNDNCLTCQDTSKDQCSSCNSSLNRVLKDQKCECIAGYYQEGSDHSQTCIKCHKSCSECNNGSTCTVCVENFENYNREQKLGGLCECKLGFFEQDGEELQCGECDTSCHTCSGVGNDKCLSCDGETTGRILQDNHCICKDNYKNLDDKYCCNNYCLTCEDQSIDQCSTCDPVLNRELKDQQCVCKEGYYQHFNGTCVKCNYACKTCSHQNSCDICEENWQVNNRLNEPQNKCPCQENFIDKILINSNNTDPECSNCHFSCSTCSDHEEDNCLTCNIEDFGRIKKIGKCECDNPYVEKGVASCCQETCKKCNNKNTCSECDFLNQFRQLNEQEQCECVDGYFQENQNIICTKCITGCQKCNSNQSCEACIENIENYNRFNDPSQLCKCKTGFYQNNQDLDCTKCHESCLNCDGESYQNCLTCDINLKRQINNEEHTCNCEQGYIDQIQINQRQICCLNTCLTCIDSITCETCNSNHFREKKDNVCTCVDKYYSIPENPICQECYFTCKTCYEQNKCDQCVENFADLNRDNDPSNRCPCSDGFIQNEDTQECDPINCDISCSTCENQNHRNCITCPQNMGRQSEIDSNFKCLCQQDYNENKKYDSDLDQYVLDIKQYCCPNNCITCTSKDTCLICNSDLHYEVNDQQKCVCIQGFYLDNNKICQKCSPGCKSCQNIDSCIECLTEGQISENRNDSPNQNCPCQNGFFEDKDNFICVKCHNSCETCQGINNNQCETCPVNSGRINTPNQEGHCLCLDGFIEKDQKICCQSSCLTCSSQNQCDSCDNSLNLELNSENQCVCIIGYYKNDTGVCEKCHYSCKSCSKFNECDSCSSLLTRVYNSNQKSCNCKIGLVDHNQKICCSIECETCDEQGLCLTCNSNKYRIKNGNQCECIQYYIENSPKTEACIRCDFGCQTCQSPNHQQCLTCVNLDENNRIDDISNTNSCPCKPGHYEVGGIKCESCLPSCKKCITLDENQLMACSECDTTEISKRQDLNEFNQCLCKEDYYERGYSFCCHVSCLDCNQNGCTQCYSNQSVYYRETMPNEISNQCECLKGYYHKIGDNKCHKCHSSCKTCSQEDSCDTCNQGMQLDTNNICTCKRGTYQPEIDYDGEITCLECDQECLTCSSPSGDCITCISTQFLPPLCQDNQCPDQQIFNDTLCIKCLDKCLTCKNDYSCLECKNLQDTEINQFEKCLQSNQYYDIQSCECQTLNYLREQAIVSNLNGGNFCPHYCSQCFQQSQLCVSCIDSKFDTPHCVCLIGYYFNNVETDQLAIGCQKCPEKCKSCTSSDPQTCVLISEEQNTGNQNQNQNTGNTQNNAQNNEKQIKIAQRDFSDINSYPFYQKIIAVCILVYIVFTIVCLICICYKKNQKKPQNLQINPKTGKKTQNQTTENNEKNYKMTDEENQDNQKTQINNTQMTDMNTLNQLSNQNLILQQNQSQQKINQSKNLQSPKKKTPQRDLDDLNLTNSQSFASNNKLYLKSVQEDIVGENTQSVFTKSKQTTTKGSNTKIGVFDDLNQNENSFELQKIETPKKNVLNDSVDTAYGAQEQQENAVSISNIGLNQFINKSNLNNSVNNSFRKLGSALTQSKIELQQKISKQEQEYLDQLENEQQNISSISFGDSDGTPRDTNNQNKQPVVMNQNQQQQQQNQQVQKQKQLQVQQQKQLQLQQQQQQKMQNNISKTPQKNQLHQQQDNLTQMQQNQKKQQFQQNNKNQNLNKITQKQQSQNNQNQIQNNQLQNQNNNQQVNKKIQKPQVKHNSFTNTNGQTQSNNQQINQQSKKLNDNIEVIDDNYDNQNTITKQPIQVQDNNIQNDIEVEQL